MTELGDHDGLSEVEITAPGHQTRSTKSAAHLLLGIWTRDELGVKADDFNTVVLAATEAALAPGGAGQVIPGHTTVPYLGLLQVLGHLLDQRR